MLRDAVEGVKSALSSDAEEETEKAEPLAEPDEAEADGNDASEIEEIEEVKEAEETEEAEEDEDAPVVSVLPPIAEAESLPSSDGPADGAEEAEPSDAEDGEGNEPVLEETEKTEETSFDLPSFDEEEEHPEAQEKAEMPSADTALSVTETVASEDEEDDDSIVLRTSVLSEAVVSAVPPSNRSYEEEDKEEPKVPDQAYRYYEPSPIDTAEVEDRLASFRHGYQKYMYTGVLLEEPEPIPEVVEKREEETILSMFAETPLPASSVTEEESSPAEEELFEESPEEAPGESFFDEEETSVAAEDAPRFSPRLEETVVSFPLVGETLTEAEAEETFSPDDEDGVSPVEAEETESVSKVYPERNGFMEDVFGAVSADDLDAEREPLLDDTVIPEEIVSPEPFNEDDYVISDRSIGEGMVSGESTREYLSYNQNEDILQGYRTRIRFCTVKLVLVSFLTALLLVTENAFLFDWTIPAFGDGLGVRGLPVLLNLQLLLLIVALSLPIFVRGITILKSKKLSRF